MIFRNSEEFKTTFAIAENVESGSSGFNPVASEPTWSGVVKVKEGMPITYTGIPAGVDVDVYETNDMVGVTYMVVTFVNGVDAEADNNVSWGDAPSAAVPQNEKEAYQSTKQSVDTEVYSKLASRQSIDIINTLLLISPTGVVMRVAPSYMKVVRLRARFTAEEDKATSIIFHGNGGTMSGGIEAFTQVVPINATIDLAVQSAAFEREHYTLIGWNTEADGSGTTFTTTQEVYANNEGLSEGESNHLYAIWQADIEITAIGPDEAVIFDGESHSNTGEYTFAYTLGGEPITEAALAELGIAVTVSGNGWPVATGVEK